VPASLAIRPLSSLEEFKAAERLQQEVWGYDALTVIPLAQLLTASKFGGLCLGAFDGVRLVALLYGFVGLKAGEPVHVSQRMAALPEYQNRGLGERLKRAQRDHVLAQGLRWIRWTYDPLETRNAHLNLNKLGGFARTYVVDLYGPVSGHVNEGLPTDRFEVEWYIRSRHASSRLAAQSGSQEERTGEIEGRLLTRASRRGDGLVTPEGVVEPPAGRAEGIWYVEAPTDIQKVKQASGELALAWRLTLRRAFQALFARGYAASALVRFDGGARAAYCVEPLAALALDDDPELPRRQAPRC
jgi:predicted GNAT superfamily acetyltransferase